MRTVGKIGLFLGFLFLLQIVLGYLFFREISFSQVQKELTYLTDRIQQDLVYEGGKWNTTLYNADPVTPNPSGSSGFSSPLYIITSDGFVIERNQVIRGFLDSSNFTHLLSFVTPQTIRLVTNESWRVLSRPIKQKGEVIGVIFGAYHSAEGVVPDENDRRLEANIAYIDSQLAYQNGGIDASHVDIRHIDYNLSFEVVTKFNKVILNNGRTPSFIDPSYVVDEMRKPSVRMVVDAVTKDQFLLVSKALLDSQKKEVGIVIAGRSLTTLYKALASYIIFSLLASFFLMMPLSLLTLFALKKDIRFLLFQKEKGDLGVPKKISFDKKESCIHLDTRVVSIPYASNQYDLCLALFSLPKKRWEQDELLARFGEEITSENGRKVYDACLSVNKKAGMKLILYKDKTYQLV